MSSIKTAISLPEPLFEQVEELAQELNTPRSRLVARALELFIRQREGWKMKQQLDIVYGEKDDSSDSKPLQRARRRSHRRLIKGEW